MSHKIFVYLHLNSVPLFISISGALKKNKQPQTLSGVFLYPTFRDDLGSKSPHTIKSSLLLRQQASVFYCVPLATALLFLCHGNCTKAIIAHYFFIVPKKSKELLPTHKQLQRQKKNPKLCLHNRSYSSKRHFQRFAMQC